jgi:hypothetical protein
MKVTSWVGLGPASHPRYMEVKLIPRIRFVKKFMDERVGYYNYWGRTINKEGEFAHVAFL